MRAKHGSVTSSTSTISVDYINAVIERLRGKQVRETTIEKKNVVRVWRIFNRFLIRLDKKPDSREGRATLFCAYLIDNGHQSQTVRSYMSAVKGLLKDDGYKWDEGQVLISSLMQACKLQNDQVCCRLPIQKPLFETLLFEIGRVFSKQVYLLVLYRAVFCLAYYGLMRIGELAEGTNPVKACDIHIASNKRKILIVLYTSKTHSEATYPQQIKNFSFRHYLLGTNTQWNKLETVS